MVDQSTLWLQYMETLSSAVTLQAGEALQSVYPFQPWNWGGQSPVTDSYSYEQWSVLNVVPSTPYLNSNTSPATQSGFDTGYGNWFNTLAIGDLATDQHYQALQAQVATAAGTYTRDVQNVQNVWRNQTGGSGQTFAAWQADPVNAGYVAQLGSDLSALTGLQAELKQYQAQIQSPVQGILTAFNDTSAQTYVTDPNSGTQRQVRIWATVPTTPWAHVQDITNANFGGDAVAGSPLSFSLDQSTSQYDYSTYSGEGGAGIWDDFIGVEAGGKISGVDWSEFDSQYTIQFDFQDFATVDVAADAWYQGTDVASYAKGPYATGFSEFASGADNFFFGVGGALSRIYTKLIVGYRPTVTVTAGSTFSTYAEQQWESEDGLEIGPFFFGSEQSGESTSSSVSVQDESLVLKSTADWPVIVGMVSAWTVPPAA